MGPTWSLFPTQGAEQPLSSPWSSPSRPWQTPGHSEATALQANMSLSQPSQEAPCTGVAPKKGGQGGVVTASNHSNWSVGMCKVSALDTLRSNWVTLKERNQTLVSL